MLFISVLVNQNKSITGLFFLILDWLLNLFRVERLEKKDSDKKISYTTWENKYILGNFNLLFVDYIFVYLLSTLLNFKKRIKKTFLIKSKLSQLDNNKFYLFNNSESIFTTTQLSLYGLKSVWKHLRFWLLPLLLSFLFVYYSFFLKSLPFSKIIFGYILIGNMFYLLFSGFVFFIKHYQYRLFTSVIQRFWRRTLIIFWAIEGSLFTMFLYLIFNASQEPIYVYDNIQIYKTHFYSWRYFLSKIILSTLIIVFTYMFLLSIKWNTFSKTNNIALVITILLLYMSWLEFYQLFHLMNCYGTTNWVYDFSDHIWNLELEFKRTRIVNHYVTIGLVAKFWHVVFAVVFWIFFLLRGIESSRYRYPLLAANLQNFVIIYIMSWLYMYPWLKYTVRKVLDIPYFWFFVNNRKLGVFLFFNDIKLYTWSLLDIIGYKKQIFFFHRNSFFYWYESSTYLGNHQFRKHNIRDLFIRSL